MHDRFAVRRIVAILGALAIAVGIIVPVSQTASVSTANAAVGSDWDPGYIISDALFYNGGDMSSADVQNFLASKGGRLARWTQSTPSMPASKYCNAYPGSASERAADILAKVGAACNISPRALLVTLQKEQSLVTATNPSDRAINAAMGYGCPDTAPCDPAVAGFFYQIYYAARQFQIYRLNPGSFNFRAGQTASIRYGPAPCTSSSPVYIRNAATAGLYNYTPYQPYGSGTGCQSNGNLNFWKFWWNWFGDPRGGDPAWVEAVFQDLLGHTSGTAGSTPQNAALINGWSRADVATSIITGDEYRIRAITQTYQRVLGRPADNAGLNYWYSLTAPGTGLPSQVAGYFLMSDELYIRSGNTPEGWVSLVYESVLGRAPDPAGLVAWSNVLRSSGRAAVYYSIYNSAESVSRRINLLYQLYLGHTTDAGGIAYLTPVLNGAGDEGVLAQVIGSTEYSLRASFRFPSGTSAAGPNPPTNQAPLPVTTSAGVSTTDPPFLTALSNDLLGTAPSAGALGVWSASLGSGMTRTWIAATVYQSAGYRTKAVSAAYQNVLGRTADSGGLNYWYASTAPGGDTLPSRVATSLLASDEYVQRSGGTTQSWVTGVSQSILGRAPSSSESATWTNIAATSGRAAMITAIYTSAESVTRRLGSLTQSLLGRASTTADSAQYRSSLALYGDEYVGAQMVGSPAYDARAQSRYPSPFLRAVGTDVLGTAPSPAYIAAWSGMLATGTTHYALASLLYGSTEYRTVQIRKAYQSVLGREPDSAGLNYWLTAIANGTVRASTMKEQFLLSDELYIRAGNTPEGWVSMLFQTVLGRVPDGAGLAYWADQVRSQGRASVLWGIYNSPESAIQRLNVMTVQLLGRGATNDDIAGLGPLMVSGGEEAVGAAIIGSRDYDTHAGSRF